MISQWLFLGSFLLTAVASAKTTVLVEGTIVSYDENIVVLKQEKGALIKVPRSHLVRQKGVLVGQEKIKVEVTPEEFTRLNPKLFTPQK